MFEIYKRSLKDEKLNKLEQFSKGSWLLLIEPSKDEIEHLISKFDIEKSQILDALDEYETPHLEIIKNKLYIFVRVLKIEKNEVKMMPLLCVVADDFILTVSKEKNIILDYFLSSKIDFYTTQKTKFLLLLLLKINHYYRYLINKITKEIEGYQSYISEITDKEIIEISKKEILLSNILANLVSMNKVYEFLLKKEYLDFLQEEKDIVDDLSLSAKELIDIVSSNLKRVKTIKDTYATILSNRVNLRLQFLTIVTVILSIPVIIFSLYGMNINLPYQDDKSILFYLLIFNFILMFLFYWILKKKKWF